MHLQKEQIIKHLESGSFDQLVGQFESEWLECKRQSYQLQFEAQKLELVKDVSGLANAAGGLLLIGFATKKSDVHGEDEIDNFRPFPISQFNNKQYEQVIKDWTWPPLVEVRVHVFRDPADETKCVAAIDIPKAANVDHPILVAKTVLEGDRKTEIFFGYCMRTRSHVTHLSVQRLHSILRDGLRLDAEFRDSFQSLQASAEEIMSRLNSLPSAEIAKVDQQQIEQRVEDAIKACQLRGSPTFVLVGIPTRKLNLRQLFESRSSEVSRLIERPPQLRDVGFNIDAGHNSKIVEGKARRSVLEEYKLLELGRDGLAIFVAHGGSDFLCWGRSNRQMDGRLINQVALVESVYLFVLLFFTACREEKDFNGTARLQLRLLGMEENGKPALLESGPASRSSSLLGVKRAASSSMNFECEVSLGKHDPERAALLLLAELYAWFGFEEDKIPYTRSTNAGRSIDPEVIKNLN